jgi:hypothetical protein
MGNRVAERLVALLSVLVLSSTVASTVVARVPQGQDQANPPANVAPGVPAMPSPPGPAPKHDLTGSWIGPQNLVMGPFPAMTPAGEARFKLNKPVTHVGDPADSVEATNVTPSSSAIRSAFRVTFGVPR